MGCFGVKVKRTTRLLTVVVSRFLWLNRLPESLWRLRHTCSRRAQIFHRTLGLLTCLFPVVIYGFLAPQLHVLGHVSTVCSFPISTKQESILYAPLSRRRFSERLVCKMIYYVVMLTVSFQWRMKTNLTRGKEMKLDCLWNLPRLFRVVFVLFQTYLIAAFTSFQLNK